MALNDFFRINMPYGINRNSKGEWFAFNREYMPLGWNSTEHQKSIFEDDVYSASPIYTKYKGLTESRLWKLGGTEDSLNFDEFGKIERVFLYNDRTNPQSNPRFWNDYFEKIKLLSSFQAKQ
jgi:hypothetical protein